MIEPKKNPGSIRGSSLFLGYDMPDPDDTTNYTTYRYLANLARMQRGALLFFGLFLGLLVGDMILGYGKTVSMPEIPIPYALSDRLFYPIIMGGCLFYYAIFLAVRFFKKAANIVILLFILTVISVAAYLTTTDFILKKSLLAFWVGNLLVALLWSSSLWNYAIIYLYSCAALLAVFHLKTIEMTPYVLSQLSALYPLCFLIAFTYEKKRRKQYDQSQLLNSHVKALKASRQALLAANAELNRTSQMKSDFLSHMSYELRTPLNAISGFAKFLEKSGNQADNSPISERKKKEYITAILANSGHLITMVNDILDISRIEGKVVNENNDQLTVEKEINRVGKDLSSFYNRKHQNLFIHCSEDLDPLYMEKKHFYKLVYNLLHNAIKYSPDGKHIILKVQKVDHYFIQLILEDEGIGIAPQDMEKIQRPFKKISTMFSNKISALNRDNDQPSGHGFDQGTGQGSGLGLTMVSVICEAYGITFDIDSKLGKGTRVTLMLPKTLSTIAPEKI